MLAFLWKRYYGLNETKEQVDRRVNEKARALIDMTKALESKENELRDILDSQIDLLVYFDLDMRITFANQAYLNTFGLTSQQIKSGVCLRDLVHPDDIEESTKYWAKMLEHGERVRFIQRAKTINGYRSFEWEGWPIFDSEGKIRGKGGSGRDVTNRVEAQNRLKLSYDIANAENTILQDIAMGSPFEEVAKKISIYTEKFSGVKIRCSILVMAEDGLLYDFWSPSLTQEYKDLMKDGFPPGEYNGACGAAAYYKDFFFVTDIETSENWTPFPDFIREAKEMSIKAVWSSVILGSHDRVLGTVAFYVERTGLPCKKCISLINWTSHVAAIAIERRKIEERLTAISKCHSKMLHCNNEFCPNRH
jgi:PAS domain S-box-containing protein